MNHFLIVFLLIGTIYSCSQFDKKVADKPIDQENSASTNTNTKIVDYKSDTYKVSIGEDYRISDKVIDWRWAGNADNDNKIDSTGQDAFLSLDEPLLRYNDAEWLPSLHIETDRNIITSFTCSVLFNLEDNIYNAEENFMQLLSKDIKQLSDNKIKSSLKSKGIYESTQDEFVEIFKLIKADELGPDRFEYTIKLKL